MTTRQLTLTAVLTALLCILGPLTLPVGPIPLSLTTALLMLMALLLGASRAALCCGVYLLIGLTGLPVFSGFTGGMGALAGPTGGFLLGYLPLTAWCGALCRRTDDRRLHGLIFLLGTALLYLIGTAWYVWQSGASPGAAIAVCVLPFLPGDGVKIAAVAIGGNAIRARLMKAGLLRSDNPSAKRPTKEVLP